MIRHWRWVIRLLPCAGVLLAWACWPVVEPRPAPRWVRVEAQRVDSRLGLVGRLEASRRQALGAAFDAVLAAVLVQPGQPVAAGQPLFVLDTAQIDIQLRQAEAERLKARAQLAELRAWREGPQMARSERALGAARANLQASEGALREARRLFERGIIARMELESLEQQAQAQRQALLDAEQDVRQTRTRGEGEALSIAGMELANAQARWQALADRRALSVVVAPFSGLLVAAPSERNDTGRPLQVGQLLSQGAPLGSLVALERLQVVTKVHEEDLAKLREGQPVQALIAGQRFEGRVEQVGQQALDDRGQAAWYALTVGLTLPKAATALGLRLGMSAQLSVELEPRRQAMVIPPQALHEDQAGQVYVLFRAQDGQPPRKVRVTPGAAVVQGIEVDGLAAGWVRLADEP
ncbi:HlyD family efflux transporter periplasmic adaptor subunit [Pseudomonas sp.]|uniref:efflux RND transporter periplasmic adaptor subunit n=1 Tax=Pseudomonas sp. TaxID=306 RepID=UPI0028AFD63B|nr:HlyD family efflux transporter periplasmic adaptor subunit [Pseudomonas sp.]